MPSHEASIPPTTSTAKVASTLYAARNPITIAYYIAFIALGLTVASLGPTLLGLAENTQTRFDEISFLFTARALGYMFGSLLGGYLYDRIPGNPIMGIMLILMAVGLATVPTISRLWLLVIVLLAVGTVDGVTDVGGNILLVWLHRDKVGPFMNALHFFFGVGAFLSPIIIAQALLRTNDITWGYWALALLIFPASIWLFRLPSPAAPQITDDQPARPVNKALITLLAIFFFLFVAAEVSFGGWIATYAIARHLANEAEAAYLTSAFWGALTIGRLLSIPIALRFKVKTILLSDLIGCLLSVGVILIWPHSSTATWLGTLGIGLALASLFPAGISLAERSMTVTGRTTGLFLIGGASGSMSIPWLIGQLFGPVGPQVVMWIVFIDLIAAIGLFFALMAILKRGEMQPQYG